MYLNTATLKNRKIIIPASALVVILIVCLASGRRNAEEVKAFKVSSGHICDEIPASGRIRPVVEVKVSPDVSGEIVELNFKEGDYVEEGDVILKIRQDQYLSQVEQAEAALSSLRADYKRQQAETRQAEINFKRSEYLYNEQAISLAEYEEARSNLAIMRERTNVAEYSMRSGRAQLKETLENLKKTTVLAPMSGIVSKLSVEKGERVVGTTQMAGTEMFRIADFSRMEAIVDVGENDIVRISSGDTAKIEIDAYPGRTFSGIVTQIANSAKNIGTTFEQVTNFEVRIEMEPESYSDLPESDKAPILPGMSATVSIVTGSLDGCLTVPLQSVFFRDRQEYVWIIEGNGHVSMREVETGIQDLSEIEVKKGLEKDEIVVCGPLSAIEKTLVEGQKVKYRF